MRPHKAASSICTCIASSSTCRWVDVVQLARWNLAHGCGLVRALTLHTSRRTVTLRSYTQMQRPLSARELVDFGDTWTHRRTVVSTEAGTCTRLQAPRKQKLTNSLRLAHSLIPLTGQPVESPAVHMPSTHRLDTALRHGVSHRIHYSHATSNLTHVQPQPDHSPCAYALTCGPLLSHRNLRQCPCPVSVQCETQTCVTCEIAPAAAAPRALLGWRVPCTPPSRGSHSQSSTGWHDRASQVWLR